MRSRPILTPLASVALLGLAPAAMAGNKKEYAFVNPHKTLWHMVITKESTGSVAPGSLIVPRDTKPRLDAPYATPGTFPGAPEARQIWALPPGLEQHFTFAMDDQTERPHRIEFYLYDHTGQKGGILFVLEAERTEDKEARSFRYKPIQRLPDGLLAGSDKVVEIAEMTYTIALDRDSWGVYDSLRDDPKRAAASKLPVNAFDSLREDPREPVSARGLKLEGAFAALAEVDETASGSQVRVETKAAKAGADR